MMITCRVFPSVDMSVHSRAKNLVGKLALSDKKSARKM